VNARTPALDDQVDALRWSSTDRPIHP
jgi:hypothetical protein